MVRTLWPSCTDPIICGFSARFAYHTQRVPPTPKPADTHSPRPIPQPTAHRLKFRNAGPNCTGAFPECGAGIIFKRSFDHCHKNVALRWNVEDEKTINAIAIASIALPNNSALCTVAGRSALLLDGNRPRLSSRAEAGAGGADQGFSSADTPAADEVCRSLSSHSTDCACSVQAKYFPHDSQTTRNEFRQHRSPPIHTLRDQYPNQPFTV